MATYIIYVATYIVHTCTTIRTLLHLICTVVYVYTYMCTHVCVPYMTHIYIYICTTCVQTDYIMTCERYMYIFFHLKVHHEWYSRWYSSNYSMHTVCMSMYTMEKCKIKSSHRHLFITSNFNF